jgi:hypothetical protein
MTRFQLLNYRPKSLLKTWFANQIMDVNAKQSVETWMILRSV